MSIAAKEQFIVNTKGRRLGVVLDVRTYERLRAAEEELADIRAYDAAAPAAHRALASGECLPLAACRTRRSARK